MWPQIALFVASLVISYMLQPKPQRGKPAAFEDFDFPTVDDGTPKIVVFGDVWLTDWTVIGVGNYRNETIVNKQKGLFGSKKADAGFRYFMSIHMGLCHSIDDMIEIKVSDRTIWTGNISSDNVSAIQIDKPDIFGGDKGEGGIQGLLKIYRGAEDQPAIPELGDMYGTVVQAGYYQNISDGYYATRPVWVPPVIEAAIVPAYRGVVTFFFDGLICSNSPYPKAWAHRVRRTVSGWDGTVWYPEKATIWLNDNKIKAMNGAHILYEAQTNSEWGRGFSASQLDLGSYKSVADQLYAEGFGICLAWRRQESLAEFMQQIISQIGAAHFVDRTTGLWKLVLIRDNYDASMLESFSYSNGLLRVEDDSNSANDLVTNSTTVTYRDPISNQDLQIRAENLAAIQKNGAILETKTYSGIPTSSLAGRLAARDMKISQSSLKKFKLVFDRRAYKLQPASVFKISLPERGIDSIVVRAVRVEHDTVTNGEITVTAIQDVFGLPATNYIKEQPNLWQPPNSEPQPVSYQYLYEVPFAELLTEFTTSQLLDMAEKSYVGVIAEQPNSLQLDFSILGKTHPEAAFEELGKGDFSFISGITSVIAQTANAVVCSLAKTISNVSIGDRAIINSEIVRIDAIDYNANTLTLARGCIDTVPAVHPESSLIMVYSNVSNVADRLFSKNTTANFKLITRTSQGELSQSSAPMTSITINNRMQRPYPPANIKLNDISYPQTLNGKLQKIEWFGRNRITQGSNIIDQQIGSIQPEETSSYRLRIFKKLTLSGSYSLVSDLSDLTSTIVYADDDSAVTPGQNDFFNLSLSKGRLTAIDTPNKALKTSQRIVLSGAQVGQYYGLMLDPNVEGSKGFPAKLVQEQFLATDTSVSFLTRLKNKIISSLNSSDKTAIKYGWYHAQTGGWRCEGISGRVLEISHKYPGQAAGNIIHFVLYASNGDVIFHHQFANAFLSEFYFDANLERCWMWFDYSGSLDLNNNIATNNTSLRTFNFDSIQASGIAFTRTPTSVATCLTRDNFCYSNNVLWCAAPSTNRKAPIVLTKLNVQTLDVETTISYTNPSTQTSPVSDSMNTDADIGKVILTSDFLYYSEDRYVDARYPNDIRYVSQRIAKFNRNNGSLVGTSILSSDVSSDLAIAQQRTIYIGKYFTDYGVIQTQTTQFALPPSQNDQFIVTTYGLDSGAVTSRKNITYLQNQEFAYHPTLKSTGIYQFYAAGYISGSTIYRTDFIIDVRNGTIVNYEDSLIVKTVNVAQAPDQNKVGFPAAAYMDIEFDVPGRFFFETTSSAEAGTGPSGSALFSDVSDAVAVKVEVWSVRDGLESLQKQVLEVSIEQA